MIFVAQGYEPKGLKTRTLELASWLQHFSHAANRASSCVESDFDEISS
jgi:hypothetical protein